MNNIPDVIAAQASALLVDSHAVYEWNRPYSANVIEASFLQRMALYSGATCISPENSTRGPNVEPGFAALAQRLNRTFKSLRAVAALVTTACVTLSAPASEQVIPPGGIPCEADWMNRSDFSTLASGGFFGVPGKCGRPW